MTKIDKMFENAGIKPLCQIPDDCCGMKNIYSDSKEFAEKLLSYLKIEEVDEEQESEEE